MSVFQSRYFSAAVAVMAAALILVGVIYVTTPPGLGRAVITSSEPTAEPAPDALEDGTLTADGLTSETTSEAEPSSAGTLDDGSSVTALQPTTVVESIGLSAEPEQGSPSGQVSSDEPVGSDPVSTPTPTPEATSTPAPKAAATPSPSPVPTQATIE
ncbi:MAG: hypothetical protein IH968_15110, partial [Gemmatimonadetes bacterium]|nr:hypothetical protein [Gemmatimonadota bacterium]